MLQEVFPVGCSVGAGFRPRSFLFSRLEDLWDPGRTLCSAQVWGDLSLDVDPHSQTWWRSLNQQLGAVLVQGGLAVSRGWSPWPPQGPSFKKLVFLMQIQQKQKVQAGRPLQQDKLDSPLENLETPDFFWPFQFFTLLVSDSSRFFLLCHSRNRWCVETTFQHRSGRRRTTQSARFI